MMRNKQISRQEQIKKCLEMQIEIKNKMERLIDEENEGYPKLIIKKKKHSKRKTKLDKKYDQIMKEEKRILREKQKKEESKRKRDSLLKLKEINKFLLRLNKEKRVRKYDKIVKERRFLEKLRNENISEKILEHKKQLKMEKQKQICKNLKKIEDRRKKREMSLRASNNLTKELLNQQKEMNNKDMKYYEYNYDTLKNKSRLMRKDENTDRFYNSTYIKMKGSQIKSGIRSEYDTLNVMKLKSTSPHIKKLTNSKHRKFKSKGIHRNTELPELKINIRQHLKKKNSVNKKKKRKIHKKNKIAKESQIIDQLIIQQDIPRKSIKIVKGKDKKMNSKKENEINFRNEIKEFNDTIRLSNYN